jgi:hypothetical protein
MSSSCKLCASEFQIPNRRLKPGDDGHPLDDQMVCKGCRRIQECEVRISELERELALEKTKGNVLAERVAALTGGETPFVPSGSGSPGDKRAFIIGCSNVKRLELPIEKMSVGAPQGTIEVQGYSGAKMKEIANKARAEVASVGDSRPTQIVIHGGLNDALNGSIEEATKEMATLIECVTERCERLDICSVPEVGTADEKLKCKELNEKFKAMCNEQTKCNFLDMTDIQKEPKKMKGIHFSGWGAECAAQAILKETVGPFVGLEESRLVQNIKDFAREGYQRRCEYRAQMGLPDPPLAHGRRFAGGASPGGNARAWQTPVWQQPPQAGWGQARAEDGLLALMRQMRGLFLQMPHF